MRQCEGCKNPYDFKNQASAWCDTCGKKYLCIHCYEIHECVPGKIRQMIIVTNPNWVCNLVKKSNKKLEQKK